MDGLDGTNKALLEWDESDVHRWFSSLGYTQYERQINGAHFSRG